MRKVDDVLRNIKAAETHIDTAIALLEQNSGGELLDGYTAGSSTRELREGKKRVTVARQRVEQLAMSTAGREKAS